MELYIIFQNKNHKYKYHPEEEKKGSVEKIMIDFNYFKMT
jgi:hypothetical protein